MRTDRTQRGLFRRFVCLMVALLVCFGSGLSAAPVAVAADKPKWHLDYGPDSGKHYPNDWSGGSTVGVDNKGNYCLYDEIDDASICRMPEAGEMPGTVDICEGADGTGARDCSKEDRHAFEKRRLEKWRKKYPNKADDPKYEKLNKFITDCVNKGGTFRECQREGGNKYLDENSPYTWVKGKISAMASNALQEAARYIGKSVVWLLEEFAKVFNDSSTIDLSKTGIGKPKGLMTVLSLLIATFLLLLQFGKVAISQRGEPAATAVTGLAKWGIISSVYVIATQTALTWSDAVSTWIINYGFHSGGSGAGDATRAMQQQLGTLFGGLITGGGGAATVGTALITGEGVAAAAVGVIIVVGIVCILAIAALWIEVLLRQAGIMILVATMPVVLAGQMSDATQEWWPKARNALIALILMKPMIVLCFAIGFGAMSEGDGVQNMFVGLVIFVLACFAWPVLAKFMTFSTVGGGSAIASGLMSSIGSSAASMSGGYRPEMGGAGAVGGGSAPAPMPCRARAAAPGPGAGAGGPSGAGSWARSACPWRSSPRARTPSSPAWRAPRATPDSTTVRPAAATSSSHSGAIPPPPDNRRKPRTAPRYRSHGSRCSLPALRPRDSR